MPSHPKLTEFLETVERSFRPTDPDSFWECERAFTDLLKPAVIRSALNEELRRLSADSNHGNGRASSELVLHVGGGTALAVSSVPQRRYLHVLPYHALYGVLSGDEVRFEQFNTPENFRHDLFDPNLRLTPAGSGTLKRGEAMRLPAGKCACDFKAEGPVLMLKFVTTALLPLEWLFNRGTLQVWQANDADISFTQLRVAADVLGKLAHQSSIEPLKLMTGHGHHAVRWAAITNLGRINKTEAVAKLKEAVDDPHPHIRNAAAKTLRKLQP